LSGKGEFSVVTSTQGDPTSPSAIDANATMKLAANDNSPLLDLAANVGLMDLKASQYATFNLSKFEMPDLAKLQQQFGSLVPVLGEEEIRISTGAISMKASGQLRGSDFELKEPLTCSISQLTVVKFKTPILTNETITANIKAAGNADHTKIDELSVK